MFRNHIKTAIRNMARHKGNTILNIAGLTIGISVCFLLFLWVKDELSYDRFHPNADQTYRAQWKARFGENEWEIPLVPVPLAGLLESEFPEVEWATQVSKNSFTLKKGGDWIREEHVLNVDEDFFKVFSVTPVAGNPSTALEDPNTIVLTEEAAERYFGNDPNVIGRTILQNNGTELTVGSVVKKWPDQSHLEFDFLAPIKNIKRFEQLQNEWGSAACYTYFTIEKDADVIALKNKIDRWVTANLMQDEFWKRGNNFTSFPFESLTSIHRKPNLAYIWIFGIIAFFILAVAAINFINLATARALTRAREVGVRKALGSPRSQLIRQFFMEAFLYVFSSLVLAVILAQLVLPFFNSIAGKHLEISFLHTPFVWSLLAGLLVVTTLLTGVFPALMLSGVNLMQSIRGELSGSGNKSNLRRGLVILQFCISLGLIIGTLVVKNQMNFLQQQNLGFDQEHVVVLRQARALDKNYDAFMDQLKQLPAVQVVSISQYLPGDGFDSSIFLPEQPSNYEETSLSYTHIDPNFVDALKLEMVAGRNIDLSHRTDSTAVLINETAAKRLGWDQPIGKKLSWGGDPGGEVVGVVKDFNFQSLHEEIEPLVMRMAQWRVSNIIVRLNPGNIADQIGSIRDLWQGMAPQSPIEYTFLDQDLQSLYEKESRMSRVFLLFATLSIFIACLGLFGLAAFMAAQRTKEIGIRKVLGASVFSVVGLLSKEFIFLVGLALVIASPVAYYAMHKWLQNFAYRVEIHWWIFILAGVMALLVAFATVSFQSIRAALADPVKSLRNE